MAREISSMLLRLVRPVPAPRGPGDLRPMLVREWQRCMRPAVVSGVLVFAIAFAIGMQLRSTAFLAISVAGMVGSWITLVGIARLLARQRMDPANRVTAATMMGLARRWRDFDGGGIPKDAAEGLARVGDRADETATALRIWSLMNGWERLDEAKAILSAWTPEEPQRVAFRLRCMAVIADPTMPVDPADVERAIAAILDPSDALSARTSFALEQAVRLDVAGADPFPPILAVAPLLGEVNVRQVMRDLG